VLARRRSHRRLRLLLAAALAALPAAADPPPRVVSLNPSITETLLALGAQSTLVGVDDMSARQEPRVRDLPRVGGLWNPSLEAIVALAPSFVALVPSAQQHELRERLEALRVEVLVLPNHRYEELLGSIERLGERVGRGAAARRRVSEIRAAWRAASERTAGAKGIPSVLVVQRDPLYVVGGGSYLDAMLRAAGAENLAGKFDEAYPRVSLEWLIAAAPALILDAAEPPEEAQQHWARWPSLPAVATGRVEVLDRRITLPGPYIDRSLEQLAEIVRADAP